MRLEHTDGEDGTEGVRGRAGDVGVTSVPKEDVTASAELTRFDDSGVVSAGPVVEAAMKAEHTMPG